MAQLNSLPAISIKDLFAGYNGKVVLEEINLEVEKGDFLGIIGPNGGGKTTLLKVILGLIRPFKGEVKVFGETPVRMRKKIGYVPQFSAFERDFPVSVEEVVSMGLLEGFNFYKKFSEVEKKQIEKVLRIVELFELKNQPIEEISEGQRQRVFIARALVKEPEILILDEPTAFVDEKMQYSLYDLLLKLKEELTIVLVSHDIGVVSQYVDKIACLNRKLFYHGGKEIPEEVLQASYRCPIDLIGHGKTPHRVLREH